MCPTMAPGQDTRVMSYRDDVASDADFKQLLSISIAFPVPPFENMLGIAGLALISCVTLKGLTKDMPLPRQPVSENGCA